MKYAFDPRNLPQGLAPDPNDPNGAQKAAQAQTDFRQAVLDKMDYSGAGKQEDSLSAAVTGMLVLDGYGDPSSSSFDDGFWAIRGEAAKTVQNSVGSDVAVKDIYDDAAQKISRLPGHGGTVYYQELASVARQLIANVANVPSDSPGFTGQIRVFDDAYTQSGPQVGNTLDFPDLSGGDAVTAPDDLRPDNIRAVGVIYAACQLDQMRMFEVVDAITEQWWNGQLPIGFGSGSQALDKYYWSSEFRLTDSARHMQYSRVLGQTGGEVSKDVQPNTQFDDLFMRLISSLAEYDRQQRVGDIIGSQRTNALTLTGEAVRQSARNLAANASLYGWGGTQFAARRIATQVQSSFDILGKGDIQTAYGVDGPWKVIERVATDQWGASPNIVKFRTMADAGKKILNILAYYSQKGVWSGTTGKPLFNDPAAGSVQAVATISDGFQLLADVIKQQQGAPNIKGQPQQPQPSLNSNPSSTSDVSDQDRDELMRQAGNYIAVMGIKSDAVSAASEPAETQYAPSIPTLSPAAAAGSNGSAGVDQLKQMILSGQTPSFDVVKSLVLPGSH